jgi:hypothetical protein
MHWISLIGVFIIVHICLSQPTTFKNFETENPNKVGTFQMGPGGNNADLSGTKNNADGSGHVNTNSVPLGNSMKHEKDGRNTLKYITNGGNNNYSYIILPFIIAVFMTIIHF